MKLAGAVEQGGDAGDTEGAKQRDLQRANRVPGEVVAERQMNDALMIPLRIEPLDFGENVPTGWARHCEFPPTSISGRQILPNGNKMMNTRQAEIAVTSESQRECRARTSLLMPSVTNRAAASSVVDLRCLAVPRVGTVRYPAD